LGNENQRAVSDERGRFTFKRLHPGRCALGIDPDQTLDFVAAPQMFDLAPGETHQANISLVTGGLIVGQVRDANTGKGVSGVSIAAGTNVARTDADGNFTLRALPGKAVVSQVGPPVEGYLYNPLQNANAQKDVTVIEGRSVAADFDLKPDPSPAFTGTVVDADGVPVSGATIDCQSPNTGRTFIALPTGPGTRPAPQARGRIVPGRFVGTFTPLNRVQSDAAGRFRVRTAANSRLIAYFEDLATEQPLTLMDPAVPVTVRLFGEPRFSLAVKVIDDAGAAVRGAEVKLLRGMKMPFVIQTADDGMAKFDNALELGNTVWIQAPGYSGAGVRLPRGLRETTVRLQRANSTIEGYVLDDQGTKVSQVGVYLNTREFTEETETDANGHFSFDVIDSLTGTVHLRGTAPEGMARARSGDNNIKLVRPAAE
jgi:protocatechuate 3,4-dioxygenase beta subunit